MTRVLIVEDQILAQDMMAHYVESASDRYSLVNRIASSEDAMSICEAMPVELILMDVCTSENASGLKAAREIKKRYPGIKIIIVTSMPEFRFIDIAREIGVESFWYKNVHSQELLQVMDRTMAGESIYPDTTPTVRVGDAESTDFTKREMEVLYYVVQGDTVASMAEKLGITDSTVRFHIDNLKSRTGCKTKLELAIMAVEAGLVLPRYA